MKGWLQGFLVAWQFLTCLPVPVRVPYEASTVSRSAAFFPLVGIGIGACLLFAMRLLPGGAAPVGAVLLLLLWTMLTGALHLDGLMDTADGLGSHRTRERMLEIMKDSRIGAMGALAGMFALALKGTSLWWLLAHADGMESGKAELSFILLSIPATSRWFMTFAVVRIPYAGSSDGMGSYFRNSGWTELAVASGFALLPFFGMPSPYGWILPLSQLGIGTAAALYIRGKLGGLTGDVYGALNELLEAAGLVAAVYVTMQAGE